MSFGENDEWIDGGDQELVVLVQHGGLLVNPAPPLLYKGPGSRPPERESGREVGRAMGRMGEVWGVRTRRGQA